MEVSIFGEACLYLTHVLLGMRVVNALNFMVRRVPCVAW
jgi:hypothetical protein